MKTVLLLASGTRGDVQPYLALARALVARGVPAVLATHAPFRALVEQAGLPFVDLGENPSDLLAAQSGALTAAGPSATLRYVRRARLMLARQLDCAFHAGRAHDAGALVGGLPTLWADTLAESLQIPLFWGLLQPLTPTRAFPSSIAQTARPLGSWLNLRSYQVVDRATWWPWRSVVNAFRQRHALLPIGAQGALARLHARQQPVLYGFSEHVVPRPHDWPAHCAITGFWQLAAAALLPAEVDAFIGDGRDVLYIGTGAGSALAPQRLLALADDALRQLGLRAVINIHGVETLTGAQRQRLCLGHNLDHAVLFPRVRAVVHHGGAGTSAAAARAGVPTVVLPVFADQFFWAGRAVALGIGVAESQRRLGGETLVRMISTVLSQDRFRAAAQRLAALLAREDGAARAADALVTALPGAWPGLVP